MPVRLLRPLLGAVSAIALVACTGSSDPPTASVATDTVEHHVAVPVGSAAEALSSAGVDYEVRLLRRGSDAVATFVVGGEVVAEERWVAGRYYQRSVGTASLLGADRWVTADVDDPAVVSLTLGLDEVAERGGRDEIEPGVVVELVAEPAPPPRRVVIEAPAPAVVVELDRVADAIGEP